MQKNSKIRTRKADHIQINLDKDVDSSLKNGLDRYQLTHEALPEIDLIDVDCSSRLFGRELNYPFLISSMTGGTAQAGEINQRLAQAAQENHLAMGVGSQRVGIEHPELMTSFKVRKFAPDILLFANLGAVQLNYTYTIEHCKTAVDALEADALILHLNPLQEAIMEDGDTRFSGLLEKIEQVCRQIPVPVIVKEVGWGISAGTAGRLIAAGVQAIDVAGAGGTSWSEVEKFRNSSPKNREIASVFKSWGIPTAVSLTEIRQINKEIPLFASGGIRNGVDAAKCLALGADLVGIARMFLKAAAESAQVLSERIEILASQLRISMFAAGAKDLRTLRKHKIFRIED